MSNMTKVMMAADNLAIAYYNLRKVDMNNLVELAHASSEFYSARRLVSHESLRMIEALKIEFSCKDDA